jgi:hypothetical protein
MGSAVRPASTTPASWDAFSNVDAFVDEVLTELTTMTAERTRTTRASSKPALAGAALRKAIMAVWCVCFCGMQWRAIGQLSGIPFGTLYSLFARCTRQRLWCRLARPATPHLAAGLRRYGRAEHGGDRQPDLPFGPELLRAGRGRRQEDPRREGPYCR